MYKKEPIGVSPAMHIYYWDERDGLSLCGWWVSKQVGGDRAWAYNVDSEAKLPPLSNWQAPWDGPVDPSIMLRVDAPVTAPRLHWSSDTAYRAGAVGFLNTAAPTTSATVCHDHCG